MPGFLLEKEACEQYLKVSPLGPRDIVHAFDDLVTLASGGFKPIPVQDADFATVVTDQLALAQISGSLGNSDPPHSQHIAEDILRQMKLIRLHAVARHQQPAGETGFDPMKTIARGGLCHLYHQFVDVAVHFSLQLRTPLKLLVEVRG